MIRIKSLLSNFMHLKFLFCRTFEKERVENLFFNLVETENILISISHFSDLVDESELSFVVFQFGNSSYCKNKLQIIDIFVPCFV